jgi:hypothetical protein
LPLYRPGIPNRTPTWPRGVFRPIGRPGRATDYYPTLKTWSRRCAIARHQSKVMAQTLGSSTSALRVLDEEALAVLPFDRIVIGLTDQHFVLDPGFDDLSGLLFR